MKLAIKYLPGVGGEFLMSLLSSKILNKPFDLNEKNHYDCTQYDCGHQSFTKVFQHVWFSDIPDYPSLISDSVGKGDSTKTNIFKSYDRITMHVWTLNIMAEITGKSTVKKALDHCPVTESICEIIKSYLK